MRSLQARLGLGLVVSLVALFSLQWFIVTASLRTLTENFVASRLAHDAESLLVAITFDAQGRAVVSPKYVNSVFYRPFSGHYYQLVSGGATLRSRSLWDQRMDVMPLPVGETQVRRAVGPQEQPLLIHVGSYHKRGRDVTIAVGEDYSGFEHEFYEFQVGYVLISLLILVALIGLQTWMLRRGFAPLERLRQDMGRLERGEIAALDSAVPAEVIPLVREINRLLGVLTERLRRSRNALGNLAHAVKTPLTVMSQAVQSEDLADQPALQAQLAAQIDTMRHYIERELKRARVAGAAAPGQLFVLDRELPPLLDALRGIYRSKGLAVDSVLPPEARYAGEREDMLELFGNLLDNACKWARGRVRLTVLDDAGLAFTVEDDGPGVPDDKREQLAQRGVRIDEDVGGYGLGLAIVGDIVRQYHGTISLGQSSALGGFEVYVSLPPSAL